MSLCGLDFGTSNSSVGVYKQNNIEMVTLDAPKKMLRSAVFLDDDERKIYLGDQAISQYMEGGEGRLMTSIKSILGTSLMQDKTRVFDEMRPYSVIIGYIIKHLKKSAELSLNAEIDSVVLGRPVHFHDDDEKADKLAENTLKDIALEQGFKHIEFQYEPIAAAMTYEQSVSREQIALIVDIGGGTSDFTIINILPKSKSKILATSGIHIGGTNFDSLLNYHDVLPSFGLHSKIKIQNGSMVDAPNKYFKDLSIWHRINSISTKQAITDVKTTFSTSNKKQQISRLIAILEKHEGHNLMQKVENAKISFSSKDKVNLDLSFIEKDFNVELSNASFEEIIKGHVNDIKKNLIALTNDASLKTSDIDVIFFTGGSSQISSIQSEVLKVFENAEVAKGNTFGSVGIGLTIDAKRKFG